MSEEIWKPIPGWEGLYEVSNLGHVKSLKGRDRKPRILSPGYTRGYPYVHLKHSGRTEMKRVHYFVAVAFIGPLPQGMQINHKNGDKADPRAENLEYVTGKQNMQHARDTLGRAPNQKLSAAQVIQIRELIAKGLADGEIARLFSVTGATINGIRHGTSWKIGND